MTTSRTSDQRHLPGPVLALCTALLVTLPAGCAGPPPQAAPVAHAGHGAPGPARPAGAAAGAAQAPGAEAALQLQALLGQHAVLAADMMRGRIRGDEDFGQAANTAIGANSEELAGIVRSLFDEAAAARFGETWAAHVAALFAYARGLATDDAVARDEARAALVRFEGDLAGFFSSASEGRLDPEAARAGVLAHVDHLLAQADAYAAGDHAGSDALYRAGHAHAFALGRDLAATLLPPEQAAELESPTWRLRSELDRLLGEHVALVVAALRAGGTDSPDFATAAQAVNGNSTDLAAAVGTLFGDAAAGEFLSLWADHVDRLTAYSAGVAAGDAARRDEAAAGLREFEARMAAFLEGATGNRLAAADLAAAFLSHDEMLLRQVDAFAAGDHQQAHALAYDTYGEMAGLARRLAEAFGETVAARLPRGGAATGGGGTAGAAGTG